MVVNVDEVVGTQFDNKIIITNTLNNDISNYDITYSYGKIIFN